MLSLLFKVQYSLIGFHAWPQKSSYLLCSPQHAAYQSSAFIVLNHHCYYFPVVRLQAESTVAKHLKFTVILNSNAFKQYEKYLIKKISSLLPVTYSGPSLETSEISDSLYFSRDILCPYNQIILYALTPLPYFCTTIAYLKHCSVPCFVQLTIHFGDCSILVHKKLPQSFLIAA